MKQPEYRLTERRMSDARFRRSEEAILNVIYKEGPHLTVSQIAKKAGLAKSTFYLHHQTAHAVIPDNKRFILERHAKAIRGQKQVKRLYATTLFFILNNKQFFIFLSEHEDRELIIAMLCRLHCHIEAWFHLPKNSDKILRIHSGGICELIINWCKNGMPESDIKKLLREAMLLTNTIRTKLAPLLE